MARKKKTRRQRRGAALRMPNVKLETKIEFPWAPAPLRTAKPSENRA